ncbi:MAG TPA: hypothetical protein PKK01_03030 [Mycobacterium sp.]|jgi:hypothetical protein|nr:hypothetical protein [Mycobacterium sp.]HPZ93537.1 hypothetical protein [Mycobacterium sp.]HQE14941.1 hypothetical protein [Mycobacterium sp.]
MTEPTPATDTLDPIVTTERHVHRDTGLYRVLAWVGIVAGILFIVAVVFCAGFFAAQARGGYGWHRGYQSGEMGSSGPTGGGCPMMQMQGGMGPGGMGGMGAGGMGPGGMPGMGPGGMAPGGSRPSTPPSSMPMIPPPAGQR